MLALFHEHGVRYMIVGGEAVLFYGHARFTGDLDIFYERSSENAERLFAALRAFWRGDVPNVESTADLLEDGSIIQFGVPPHRMDLINSISGVGFGEAWTRRNVVRMGEAEVFYIGLEDLIQNKRTVNRPKDAEDIRFLLRRQRSD